MPQNGAMMIPQVRSWAASAGRSQIQATSVPLLDLVVDSSDTSNTRSKAESRPTPHCPQQSTKKGPGRCGGTESLRFYLYPTQISSFSSGRVC